MGSFYLTCSLSGMTLSRQKTSVLLLAPAFCKNFEPHTSSICSNDGSQYENWKYLLDFNKYTNNLLENDINENNEIYDN